MSRLIEVRTYRLKAGAHSAFHEAMRDRAVPFIRSRGMDVVAFGRSDHEEETYFLVRAYEDRASLDKQQSQFYGSEDWRQGPRQELIDHIETYMNTLIYLTAEAVESMRSLNGGQSA